MPAEVQPTSLARTSPHTIPTRPALARARPGRSSRDAGPRLSSSRSRMSGASASPIGTLSQKIQCQEMPLTIAPPTSGPSATARPLIPPQMPSARPRRSAGTEADRMVSVNGITIAPPRPWAARATSSAKIDGASAAAADADREDRDADHQQPPPAEAVAQRRAGQQQHGEGQRVRVDRPLKPAEAGVQILAEHRDRGRHDEVVQRDHEHRDRGDRQRPQRLRRHCQPRPRGVRHARRLPLDARRIHRWGGVLVHARTPLKTGMWRRRRSLQGLPRVTGAVATSTSGDRGEAEKTPSSGSRSATH